MSEDPESLYDSFVQNFVQDPRFGTVFSGVTPAPLFVDRSKRWRQRYGATTYLGNLCDPGFLVDLPLVGSNDCKTGVFCASYGLKDKTLGCLAVHLHHSDFVAEGTVFQPGLDGRCLDGQAVVVPHAFHCSDPLCPVCCRFWAGQMVARSIRRFDAFFALDLPGFEMVHSMVSVPECDFHLSLDVLFRKAGSVLQMVGVDGGNLLYHPKRWDKDRSCWYFSPHFHSVGVALGGLVDGDLVKRVFSHSGYIMRRIRVLESSDDLKRVFMYQLSHAGVPSGSKHVVRWFGSMAYNRLSVPKADNEKPVCPLCGGRLRHVAFGDYVEVKGENRHSRLVFQHRTVPKVVSDHEGSVCLVDPGGWHYVERWDRNCFDAVSLGISYCLGNDHG